MEGEGCQGRRLGATQLVTGHHPNEDCDSPAGQQRPTLPSSEGPECTFPQRSTRGPGARGRMLLPQTEGNGGPNPVRAGITWPPGAPPRSPPPAAECISPVRLHHSPLCPRVRRGCAAAAPLQGCILLPRTNSLSPSGTAVWLCPVSSYYAKPSK